jgi:MFS family permease
MEPREVPARILPVIVLSQFAGTSLWFAGNAILPDLQRELGLGDGAVGPITSAVQLGFICGTLLFAFLGISDRFSPVRVFLACALCGAAANASLVLAAAMPAPYAYVLAMRFSTGLFLAGIYPVGMKIAASWYRTGLGNALGFLVGALVLGTAFPHLLKGMGAHLPWATVILALSVIAVGGGLAMGLWVSDGPNLARGGRFEPRAMFSIFSSRELRASAGGYFGHMWELYTYWAFVPLLLAAHASRHGDAINVGLWSFVVIGAGAVGSVAGGGISRRRGSAPVAVAQLSASGICCLLSPLAFALPQPAFLAFLAAWGIFVVGDSPQFSALTAATAPRAMVGSALTIVNCIGFALTIFSIELTTFLAQRLPAAWWFVPVAVGPLVGVLAARPLLRRPPG